MGKSLRDQAKEEEARREQMRLSPHEPSIRDLKRPKNPPEWAVELWKKIQALMVSCLVLTTALSAQQRHYASSTSCQAGVAVSEPIFGFSKPDSIEIAAHEEMHRRQLAAGCDSVLAVWGQDFKVKMEAEAEAFCYGMKVAGLNPEQRKRREIQQTMWWMKYQVGYYWDDYMNQFDRWCQ